MFFSPSNQNSNNNFIAKSSICITDQKGELDNKKMLVDNLGDIEGSIQEEITIVNSLLAEMVPP